MIYDCTPEHLAAAVHQLKAGELVAFPTETVYGLGADAQSRRAVQAVFARKGRPADHPVIVHVRDAAEAQTWTAHWPAAAAQLAMCFWPGPLTLVCKRAAHVDDVITGGQDTVALRCPAHPVAQQLLHAFNGALVAPSANRYGHVSPTTANHVQAEFGDELFVLDGGPCSVGIESTIVDVTGEPRILRLGRLGEAALAGALNQSTAQPTTQPAAQSAAPLLGSFEPTQQPVPRVPGAVSAHYAPRTPLHWVDESALSVTVAHYVAQGKVAVWSVTPPGQGESLWLPAPLIAIEYAQALYAQLRLLDASGADHLVVSLPVAAARAKPINAEAAALADALWAAVTDRLHRAAAAYR